MSSAFEDTKVAYNWIAGADALQRWIDGPKSCESRMAEYNEARMRMFEAARSCTAPVMAMFVQGTGKRFLYATAYPVSLGIVVYDIGSTHDWMFCGEIMHKIMAKQQSAGMGKDVATPLKREFWKPLSPHLHLDLASRTCVKNAGLSFRPD